MIFLTCVVAWENYLIQYNHRDNSSNTCAHYEVEFSNRSHIVLLGLEGHGAGSSARQNKKPRSNDEIKQLTEKYHIPKAFHSVGMQDTFANSHCRPPGQDADSKQPLS